MYYFTYPTPSTNPLDFMNEVRRLWGVNIQEQDMQISAMELRLASCDSYWYPAFRGEETEVRAYIDANIETCIDLCVGYAPTIEWMDKTEKLREAISAKRDRENYVRQNRIFHEFIDELPF